MFYSINLSGFFLGGMNSHLLVLLLTLRGCGSSPGRTFYHLYNGMMVHPTQLCVVPRWNGPYRACSKVHTGGFPMDSALVVPGS